MNTLVDNKLDETLFINMSLTKQHITRPFMDSIKNELSSLQIHALSTLVTQGPMNMTELAKKLFIAKQQMTQVIAKLIETGFVKREYSRYDQRVVILTYTPAGKEFIDAHVSDFSENFKEKLTEAEVSPQEEEDFYEALRTIATVLGRFC